MSRISIAVITKNEEKRLRACLDSARWADEIVVVDSQSSDATVTIAREYGAKVSLRPFDNFAEQKNAALDQTTQPWVFFLDADEIISDALRRELQERAQNPSSLDGYFVRRDNYFFGRCLRHGGVSEDKQMRLFRRGKARFRNPVHEEVDIEGPLGTLDNRLAHYSCANLNEYFDKFIQYTDLEVRRMREKGISFEWSRLLIRPWIRFAATYVGKGGFRDGYEGFLFHTLSAFYTFVKYAKLKENVNGKRREGLA